MIGLKALGDAMEAAHIPPNSRQVTAYNFADILKNLVSIAIRTKYVPTWGKYIGYAGIIGLFSAMMGFISDKGKHDLKVEDVKHGPPTLLGKAFTWGGALAEEGDAATSAVRIGMFLSFGLAILAGSRTVRQKKVKTGGLLEKVGKRVLQPEKRDTTPVTVGHVMSYAAAKLGWFVGIAEAAPQAFNHAPAPGVPAPAAVPIGDLLSATT